MTSSSNILKQSMIELGDHTKLIRLATVTTFIHSLLFIIYMVYLLYNISQKNNSNSGIWDLVGEYVDIVAPTTEILVILVIIWIVLLIGYTLLPPIWDASMIYYLESEKKSWSASLWKWITKFFPMFEFNATMTMFNFLTIGIAISRLYMMDIFNGLTITLIVLWLIFAIIAMILLPYTKFFITIDDIPYFKAMKKSAWLAIFNMWITLKFIVINILLYLRFIVNIFIVVGIPLLLLRGASTLEIAENPFFNTAVIIIIIALVALTAYINGIIEAFFITYWWKVFKKITTQEQILSIE